MLLDAPLPVELDEAAEPVPLAVDELLLPVVLLELLELSVAAPKTPPCTVSGDWPVASAAADLYASRVLFVLLYPQY